MRHESIIPKEIDILGVPLSIFSSYEDVEASVVRLMESDCDRSISCVAINSEKIYHAQQNSGLMEQIRSAEMHICDGVGAAIAARILHGVSISRVTGIGLFFRLIKTAAAKRWKVYILGASAESNRKACEVLQKKHPELLIAGHHDGYFTDKDDIVKDVNESGAQLLFVALGSPLQGKWIFDNRPRLKPAFLMGIGGTLDVVSGREKWAPEFLRNAGLEWLYRLVCKPSRLHRQIVLPLFALNVLKAKITGHKGSIDAF